MQITLDEFDQYVDPKIFQRGRDYFEDGNVCDLEQIETGRYEAQVEGTEVYDVSISLDGDIVIASECSCPYDMSVYCKHVVAVVLYLQEIFDQDRELGHKTTKAEQKKLSVAEQVDAILDAVECTELEEFVKQLALEDKVFRGKFIMAFAYLRQAESRQFYARQVKAILNNASGRDGFIYRQSTQSVYGEVSTILVTAQQQVARKQYHSAILMCSAVMEELVVALQFSDDSDGVIGACIEQAVHLLQGLSELDLPEADRTFLLQYCVDAFKSKVYDGWDWHVSVLELAVNLVKTEGETTAVLTLMKCVRKDEYVKRQAQVFTVRLLEKSNSVAQAEKFLAKHIANPDLRRMAIDRAIENEDYVRAESLAHDGIKLDAIDSPGFLTDWHECLLNIALRRNDTEATIENARYMYLNAHDNSMIYYNTLRKHVDPLNWNKYIGALIEDLVQSGRWDSKTKVAEIYISEKWWPHLLEYVEQNASLHFIERYEKYLVNSYAAELAMLYRQCIVLYLENNVGRNHYRTARHYIRRIQKLGEASLAQGLIEYLQHQYPRRSALLDELREL